MTVVFRNFNRAELDQQYNNLAKVSPDVLKAHRQYWEQESERAKGAWVHQLDIPYGKTALEKLDIYQPSSEGPHPVVIYIHGGYWRSGDKADCGYLSNALCAAGAVAVIINYGLVPATPVGEQVEHCAAAVRWTRENIKAHGGDPDQIIVIGHSAGAHLAAMLLAMPAGRPILPEGAIKGIYALSGIYDLEPVARSYLNDSVALSDDDVRRFSPVRLDHHVKVPCVVGVGLDEGDEYVRQAQEMARHWQHGGVAVALRLFANEDHFTIRSKWDRSGNPVFDQVLELLPHSDKFQGRVAVKETSRV